MAYCEYVCAAILSGYCFMCRGCDVSCDLMAAVTVDVPLKDARVFQDGVLFLEKRRGALPLSTAQLLHLQRLLVGQGQAGEKTIPGGSQ